MTLLITRIINGNLPWEVERDNAAWYDLHKQINYFICWRSQHWGYLPYQKPVKEQMSKLDKLIDMLSKVGQRELQNERIWAFAATRRILMLLFHQQTNPTSEERADWIFLLGNSIRTIIEHRTSVFHRVLFIIPNTITADDGCLSDWIPIIAKAHLGPLYCGKSEIDWCVEGR